MESALRSCGISTQAIHRFKTLKCIHQQPQSFASTQLLTCIMYTSSPHSNRFLLAQYSSHQHYHRFASGIPDNNQVSKNSPSLTNEFKISKKTMQSKQVFEDSVEHHILVSALHFIKDTSRLSDLASNVSKFSLVYRQAALGVIIENLYNAGKIAKCIQLCSGESVSDYHIQPNGRIFDTLIIKACLEGSFQDIQVAKDLTKLAILRKIKLGTPAISILIEKLDQSNDWDSLQLLWKHVMLSNGSIDDISANASIGFLHLHIHLAKQILNPIKYVDLILMEDSSKSDTLSISSQHLKAMDELLQARSVEDMTMHALYMLVQTLIRLNWKHEAMNLERLVVIAYSSHGLKHSMFAELRRFVNSSYSEQRIKEDRFGKRLLEFAGENWSREQWYRVSMKLLHTLIVKGWVQEAGQVSRAIRKLYINLNELIQEIGKDNLQNPMAAVFLLRLSVSESRLVVKRDIFSTMQKLVRQLQEKHSAQKVMAFFGNAMQTIYGDGTNANAVILCDAMLQGMLDTFMTSWDAKDIFELVFRYWIKAPSRLVQILILHVESKKWTDISKSIQTWATD
ncbi:hypothetical protein QVD99_004247 [Batrachochytrium dendrobatidis]|nr:hypothetical protein QVD99_004247 [Batrachochytrium dendrobatidis]